VWRSSPARRCSWGSGSRWGVARRARPTMRSVRRIARRSVRADRPIASSTATAKCRARANAPGWAWPASSAAVDPTRAPLARTTRARQATQAVVEGAESPASKRGTATSRRRRPARRARSTSPRAPRAWDPSERHPRPGRAGRPQRGSVLEVRGTVARRSALATRLVPAIRSAMGATRRAPDVTEPARGPARPERIAVRPETARRASLERAPRSRGAARSWLEPSEAALPPRSAWIAPR
jgi:hypothetical protein